MANSTLNIDVIAKECLMILDNEMVMPKKVHRGLEKEFGNAMNGYQSGDTVTIKRPTDFTVRDGKTASSQDVVEGSTSITVNKQKGIDFEFDSKELTLDIKDLSERVIKPAMVQLANQVDSDVMDLYKQVPSWVGTPGQTINAFTDFSKAPERLDELAVPQADRCSVLSPSDHWGLAGSQTALYMQNVASNAYRKGQIGDIGGVDTYMSQNVPTHTVGVATGTPLVKGASQVSTYTAVKDTMTQTLNTDGWTNSTTGILKAGDVITIAGVFAVNPVTKASTDFLREFTVVADANSGASTGPAALTVYPAIIIDGAFQNCSTTPADNAAITVKGTGGVGYRQNMAFHKNAFALAMVPLQKPNDGRPSSRQSYKGTSVRLVPYYDGASDANKWRLDILYGVKAIDPRLATRISGTA